MHENNILTQIDKVTGQPDLGILMDQSFKLVITFFNDAKVNKILATIERSFQYVTITTFKLLYRTLVCQQPEYCSAV